MRSESWAGIVSSASAQASEKRLSQVLEIADVGHLGLPLPEAGLANGGDHERLVLDRDARPVGTLRVAPEQRATSDWVNAELKRPRVREAAVLSRPSRRGRGIRQADRLGSCAELLPDHQFAIRASSG